MNDLDEAAGPTTGHGHAARAFEAPITQARNPIGLPSRQTESPG
jgi:hypothetical protein